MAYMNILKFHSVQLPPINSRIVLTNPDKAYTSGDTIAGELSLSCQKDIYSFGIKIALEGRAMVKFKDQGHQSKSVVLLELSTYVYGKGEQRIRLQPGDHIFPFSFDLPTLSSLPGSFRSPFGLILYQIVAYVQLEWKLVRKSEKTLTISSYLNLSQELGLSNPISYEKTEKFLLPSMISRRMAPPFRFNFRMTQSGFLVGEEIPFELELDNPAGYEIALLVVTLVQKITYSAGTASKIKQKVMARVETGNMDSPNGTLWTEAILVPQGTLPNQKGIIEIGYSIKIEIKPNGQVCPLKGDIPITIGTTRENFLTLLRNSPESQSDGLKKADEALLSVTSTRARERSASPSRSRNRRACHKSLDRDRGETARLTHPGPPRYSVLSIRSSSIETLPPTYEDVLKEEGNCAETPDPAEFKTFAEEVVQDDDNEDDEEDRPDEKNNVDELETPDLDNVDELETPNVENADVSSKL